MRTEGDKGLTHDHRCLRGWNSATRRPVMGSGALRRVYLWLLQPWQARARLLKEAEPRWCRGMMCSTERGSGQNFAGLLQCSQRAPARFAIRRRMSAQPCLAIGERVEAKRFHQLGHRDLAQRGQGDKALGPASIDSFRFIT